MSTSNQTVRYEITITVKVVTDLHHRELRAQGNQRLRTNIPDIIEYQRYSPNIEVITNDLDW